MPRARETGECVLITELYKSEVLPHWSFKTSDIARESATKIFELFLNYKESTDFVGMDMTRKFLQMGFTLARRSKGSTAYEYTEFHRKIKNSL